MLQVGSLWSLTCQLFHDYTIRHQNIQFPSCSKQFSFLADCFIAQARCPINKHLHSHDSDKWKPPLDLYEIVYPQKLLTWRYEKLGCPGIYHILIVQCHFEIVKWLRHLLHLSYILLSQYCTTSIVFLRTHTHTLEIRLLASCFLDAPPLTCF